GHEARGERRQRERDHAELVERHLVGGVAQASSGEQQRDARREEYGLDKAQRRGAGGEVGAQRRQRNRHARDHERRRELRRGDRLEVPRVRQLPRQVASARRAQDVDRLADAADRVRQRRAYRRRERSRNAHRERRAAAQAPVVRATHAVISFTRQFLRGQKGETMRTLAAALLGLLTPAFLVAGIVVNSAIAQDKGAGPAVKMKVLVDNDKAKAYEATYAPGAQNKGVVTSTVRIVRALKGG